MVRGLGTVYLSRRGFETGVSVVVGAGWDTDVSVNGCLKMEDL